MAGGRKTARVGLCRVSLGWSVKTALFYFFFQLKTQQREAVEQFPWWCFVGQKPFRKSGWGFFLKTKCFMVCVFRVFIRSCKILEAFPSFSLQKQLWAPRLEAIRLPNTSARAGWWR